MRSRLGPCDSPARNVPGPSIDHPSGQTLGRHERQALFDPGLEPTIEIVRLATVSLEKLGDESAPLTYLTHDDYWNVLLQILQACSDLTDRHVNGRPNVSLVPLVSFPDVEEQHSMPLGEGLFGMHEFSLELASIVVGFFPMRSWQAANLGDGSKTAPDSARATNEGLTATALMTSRRLSKPQMLCKMPSSGTGRAVP